MREVRLSRLARADVRRITSYLFQHGFDASVHRRFLVSFEETCLRIAEHPGVGQVIEPLRNAEGARHRVVLDKFPKYLLFYRATDATVTVQRVLHGSQDIPSLLRLKGSDA